MQALTCKHEGKKLYFQCVVSVPSKDLNLHAFWNEGRNNAKALDKEQAEILMDNLVPALGSEYTEFALEELPSDHVQDLYYIHGADGKPIPQGGYDA